MQLCSGLALQRNPVLEPLVSQGFAATGDHAELDRLPLHHALPDGRLHNLRQCHDVEGRLTASNRPDRVGDFHPVAAGVGQAEVFQLEYRAVGLLKQCPVVEPPVAGRGGAAHLHSQLGTSPDQSHGIL